MAYTYNPNPFYYDEDGGIVHDFWEEGSNSKLAELGIKNHLPCGGKWVLGTGFAFCIEYPADSYNRMSRVLEFGEVVTDKWNELKLHLEHLESTWYSLKSRDEVAEILGIEAVR